MCHYTIVSSLFNFVFYGLRIFEMDCLRDYRGFRSLSRVRLQDELANVGLVTYPGLDIFLVAYKLFLGNITCQLELGRMVVSGFIHQYRPDWL